MAPNSHYNLQRSVTPSLRTAKFKKRAPNCHYYLQRAVTPNWNCHYYLQRAVTPYWNCHYYLQRAVTPSWRHFFKGLGNPLKILIAVYF